MRFGKVWSLKMAHFSRPIFQYKRLPDNCREAVLRGTSTSSDPGNIISTRLFGNFLEHLGPSIHGGLWGEELANPVFVRDANLTTKQKAELLQAGHYLSKLFLTDKLSNFTQLDSWSPSNFTSGFGVAVLDDTVEQGLPFPWAAVGETGHVSASVGRIDGAVRIQGVSSQGQNDLDLIRTDRGPSGIRQGVFLPFGRTLTYFGDVWARINSQDNSAAGEIEVGFSRRFGHSYSPEGQVLSSVRLPISGIGWTKLPYKLSLPEKSVRIGEPVDFFLRWLPLSTPDLHLFVDRIFLFASDVIEGLDPEVVRLAQELPVSLLRWPGGNFASDYHWRDGVGPLDRRPPRPNRAWGGLEYNYFGTSEYIHFCRRIGAEPQITVNTGTGSPEEAADWVEYCNGDRTTRMGRLRAEHGDQEPYHVTLWEVGNETYGSWQAGFHGGEENAWRYLEFARAMRDVDPNIELIATGNCFDFVDPSPLYDHTTADTRWNQSLIQVSGKELDYISLHSLPYNDFRLEHIPSIEATYSILAQPTVWERYFLPDLLEQMSADKQKDHSTRLAITEWGILGSRDDRPLIYNFGEAIYAGLLFNILIRNQETIVIANSSALLSLGYIRKTGWQVYYDPKYLVMQQYARLVGAQRLACSLEASGYDVATPSDLSAPITDIPYIDAVLCWIAPDAGQNSGLHLAVVNRHLQQEFNLQVQISIPDGWTLEDLATEGTLTYYTNSDPCARSTPSKTHPFSLCFDHLIREKDVFSLPLPPYSVSWGWFPLKIPK